jgi:hypothetical protein
LWPLCYTLQLSQTMPSDQSTWLLAVPHDDDSENVVQDVSSGLVNQGITKSPRVGLLGIPAFKVKPLPCMCIILNIACFRQEPSSHSSLSLRNYLNKTLTLHQSSPSLLMYCEAYLITISLRYLSTRESMTFPRRITWLEADKPDGNGMRVDIASSAICARSLIR